MELDNKWGLESKFTDIVFLRKIENPFKNINKKKYD